MHELRRWFREERGVTVGELDSIVRLIRTHVNLSLPRAFATSEGLT